MKNDISIHDGFSRYLILGAVAVTIFVAIVYSFYVSIQMVNKYAPLVDATMEIKFEATTAHLWFEEIISGDTHENFEDILKHIDQAKWYAKAMLEGGRNPEGTFRPLSDLLLRKIIASVIEHLKAFEDMTRKRYKSVETAGIGTAIDQQYDRLFVKFINQVDNVETLLQQRRIVLRLWS